MIVLENLGLLTDDEALKIAHALWDESNIALDGLPANTNSFDWSFMTLPETMPGLAQKHFIEKWLPEDDKTGWQHKPSIQIFGNSPNGLNHDSQDVDSRLWQVGNAMASLRNSGRQLVLSETEEMNLQRLLAIWVDAAIPELASANFPSFLTFGNAHKQRLQTVTEIFPAITREIDIPKETSEKTLCKNATHDRESNTSVCFSDKHSQIYAKSSSRRRDRTESWIDI